MNVRANTSDTEEERNEMDYNIAVVYWSNKAELNNHNCININPVYLSLKQVLK